MISVRSQVDHFYRGVLRVRGSVYVVDPGDLAITVGAGLAVDLAREQERRMAQERQAEAQRRAQAAKAALGHAGSPMPAAGRGPGQSDESTPPAPVKRRPGRPPIHGRYMRQRLEGDVS